MLTWIEKGTGEPATAIDLAEARLGVKFPAAYRAMLEEHSGGESEELESMLITCDLLPMTEYPKFPSLAMWGESILSRVIPIFETVEGNFFALDYRCGEVPGVFRIDYESEQSGPAQRYTSFEEFISEIRTRHRSV